MAYDRTEKEIGVIQPGGSPVLLIVWDCRYARENGIPWAPVVGPPGKNGGLA